MTRRILTALFFLGVVCLLGAGSAGAEGGTFKIAVHTSLTGPAAFAGKAYLEAVRFAVDEANGRPAGPHFSIQVFDDGSTEEGARAVIEQVIASNAALVLGPARTPLAILACRLYGEAGVPIIVSTIHADEITENPTTFRTVISTGEIGETLAEYLGRILHAKRAVVLSIDNGYGRPLAQHFRLAADRQGIAANYRVFRTPAERDALARELAAVKDQAPIILGMSYEDAVPVLILLRRQGYRGLVMGTATMARASFSGLFAQEPEERETPGFFTEGAYSASPMILDSANAEILDFADRFEARFHEEPGWEAVQAYDGALMAMAALRDASTRHVNLDIDRVIVQREAALASLKSFDAPTRAVAGLNGPIWFTADRIRRQPVRIGRFHAGAYESAPLQLLPVTAPDPAELATGAVFEAEAGRFYRLQRVVQTGTYLNMIPRIDIAKSSFTADFYLWLRYARDGGPGAADPIDITFPDLLTGRFDPARPAEATETPDGTEYRLWRVQGDFRADFDLHRFPFDRQALHLRFLNARASSDRIVYVLDRRTNSTEASAPPPPADRNGVAGIATAAAATSVVSNDRTGSVVVSPAAFKDLTQWDPLGAQERRDTLVTNSALGDLRRIGLETPRELSGFLVTVELQRRTSAALVKMLVPLLLMCVIMYSTLHFPHALTKEKVTVAVTAALSGAVFLSAVNNQLGSVGYTIAVEYGFYAFFGLGLLCILYVMAFETLRLGGQPVMARRLEHATRVLFLLAVTATMALGVSMYLNGHPMSTP